MSTAKTLISPPHALIFPLPFQGPVNCNLKLAELLCISGIHVTFLNTHHIHRRLLRHTDVQSRFSRYPHFKFESITDGLPEDNPRSVDQFGELMGGIEAVTAPIFREMVSSGGLSRRSGRPVTCIIAEGIFGFALDVSEEIGVPFFYFDRNDLDSKITCVQGMEDFLRQRDLPGFCRDEDPANPSPQLQVVLKEVKQIPRAKGLILNTFEDLDGSVLSRIRTICPNTYTIGPLHAHLKTRLTAEAMSIRPPTSSSNSLWEEDRSCITWLDQQPSKSVIYISIGSLTIMTWDQLMEFWHGLVNSGERFLWVRRPGSVREKETEIEIPVELLEGTKERGCVVGWAPQEEVLAHPSIGGFLTHSGWNSTLESIAEGVPMICWPHYVDQHVSSRFVSEVWKIGMDMKDTCDRVVIEEMVRDLMELRREEFIQSAHILAKSSKKCLSKYGSSYCSLNRLVEDIKSRSLSKPYA
ncbi:hypothetical protein LguiB_029448 [Lonicera macranthoides]